MKRIAVATLAAVALLSIAAAALLAAGCGGVPSDAVATVGGESVTKAEFQDLLEQARKQMEGQGVTFPTEDSSAYDQYAAQIVSYLVRAQIVAQSADGLGVSVSDKEVASQVTQIEEAYGGEEKVLALLEQQGMTMELLRQSLRDQALTQKVAAAVVKKASVSDADIQAYWAAHKAQLSKKKRTATLAKAKATIRQNLLGAAKQQLWTAWLAERSRALGVEYAAGFDPAELAASPSPSASAAAPATPR